MSDEPGPGDRDGRPWWMTEQPAGRPLPVDGGVRARSQRGSIGRSWWSARFVAVLEEIGVGGRLGRGRAYARSGQVISLDVSAGSVRAVVQGSRPAPYDARIGVPTFGKPQWARVEQAMAESAWYAAKLLAGEMPGDIEDVFTAVGLTLFPTTAAELVMDCACPDHQVPCKHLAAVCYLLAESFDTDPFGMLALRGRDRATLLANIRARRPAAPAPGEPAAGPAPADRVLSGTADHDSAERTVADHDSGEPGADHDSGERTGAARTVEGGPGAGGPGDRGNGVPALADCLAEFYLLAGPLPALVAPVTRPDAVLDQVPAVRLTVRGRELTELLRPFYRSLADPG